MANVTGDFNQNSAELQAGVNAILQTRLRQIIRLVAADARVNAPVDTGRMAQAIKEDPIVFASSVNHPGTRPRPFLTNAVARVLRDLT